MTLLVELKFFFFVFYGLIGAGVAPPPHTHQGLLFLHRLMGASDVRRLAPSSPSVTRTHVLCLFKRLRSESGMQLINLASAPSLFHV